MLSPALCPGSSQARRRRLPGVIPDADPDPGSRYFAIENGQVVGYAAFGPNGRISYPWCLPGAEAYREPLLDAVLTEMHSAGWPKHGPPIEAPGLLCWISCANMASSKSER